MVSTLLSKIRLLILLVIAIAGLSGCRSLPSFEQPSAASDRQIGLDELVHHLECTLVRIVAAKHIDSLSKHRYVVDASMSIEVSQTQGFAPSLSFIHPFSTEGTSRSLGLSGKYEGTQHKNITKNFTLLIGPEEAASHAANCPTDPGDGNGLNGDLGLEDAIAMAIGSNFIFSIPEALKDHIDGDGVEPNFSISVDFQIAKGAGASPNWTLVHRVGPTADGSLLNWSKEAKDTLTLSFAKMSEKLDQKDAVKKATRSAQDGLSRRLLQQIRPQR